MILYRKKGIFTIF